MKQVATALALLLLLVIGAIVAYRALFATVPVTVSVQSVVGEASITGSAGRQVAVPGTTVVAGDRVETAPDGRLVLSAAPGEEILVTSDTEVVVKDLGDKRMVFELTHGQVQASLKPYNGRTVTFQAPGNDVEVRSHGGTFTMSHDGWGTYDVVPRSGETELVKDGEAQPIEVGSRVVVTPDGASRQETSLERAVLLKVDWPEAAGADVEVRGQADVGSQVAVGGQRARVGADGTFTMTVPVPETGRVEVRARTSLGEATSTSPDLRAAAPTPPPTPAQATPPPPPRLKVTQTGEWK